MNTHQQPHRPAPVMNEEPIAVLSLPSRKARWALFVITVCVGLLLMRTAEFGSAVVSIRLVLIGLAVLAGVSSNWSA